MGSVGFGVGECVVVGLYDGRCVSVGLVVGGIVLHIENRARAKTTANMSAPKYTTTLNTGILYSHGYLVGLLLGGGVGS